MIVAYSVCAAITAVLYSRWAAKKHEHLDTVECAMLGLLFGVVWPATALIAVLAKVAGSAR